ncbi:hypothetical protein N1F89_14840 [Aquibium sp. A9E412]|uniref:hypothetical protein n=1 Tax=Aquibium sp. A9E412 TaxID=2976767 RepID=UPI0025B13CC2|nr:hypothetical protein [Aquibium sp. A9E412]MDN2567499.1 hypothetical protein [Aquibium sp. A9E412]
MGAGLIGALVGLVLAAVDYALLRMLAGRVEMAETKRVLHVTGLVQFVLLPVVGFVVAPYLVGE